MLFYFLFAFAIVNVYAAKAHDDLYPCIGTHTAAEQAQRTYGDAALRREPWVCDESNDSGRRHEGTSRKEALTQIPYANT